MPTTPATTHPQPAPPPQWNQFRPNPAQLDFLDNALATEAYSIACCCRNSGISSNTYYRWCRQPGFRAWFTRRLSEDFLLRGWHLITTAHVKSREDFKYWQAAFNFTFDPAGQALLQQWQQNLQDSAAYFPNVEDDPAPADAPAAAAQPDRPAPPDHDPGGWFQKLAEDAASLRGSLEAQARQQVPLPAIAATTPRDQRERPKARSGVPTSKRPAAAVHLQEGSVHRRPLPVDAILRFRRNFRAAAKAAGGAGRIAMPRAAHL